MKKFKFESLKEKLIVFDLGAMLKAIRVGKITLISCNCSTNCHYQVTAFKKEVRGVVDFDQSA